MWKVLFDKRAEILALFFGNTTDMKELTKHSCTALPVQKCLELPMTHIVF